MTPRQARDFPPRRVGDTLIDATGRCPAELMSMLNDHPAEYPTAFAAYNKRCVLTRTGHRNRRRDLIQTLGLDQKPQRARPRSPSAHKKLKAQPQGMEAAVVNHDTGGGTDLNDEQSDAQLKEVMQEQGNGDLNDEQSNDQMMDVM
jgi:hypothetical protein